MNQQATPAPAPAPAAPPSTAPNPAPPADPRPPRPLVDPSSMRAQRSYTGATMIMPQTFEEVQRIAKLFASAGEMVPKDFRENPAGCAMAIMWGMELGVSPIQAIQGIAVIRGRPAVWGDLLLALVQRSPEFDDILEEEITEPTRDGKTMVVGARCTVWRAGRQRPRVQVFTLEDAKRANLWPAKEDAAWTKYTNRMLKMRARSWACRDEFPDVLRGMAVVEEMFAGHTIDGEARDVTPPRSSEAPIGQPREVAPSPPPPALEHQPNPLAASMAEQIRAATPELATLAAAAVPRTASGEVSFDDLDDLGATVSDSPPPHTATGTEGQPDHSGGGELFPTAAAHSAPPMPDPPPAPRKPLTPGARSMLNVYLGEAAQFGIMEQTLCDELGDDVHAGNVQQAISLLVGWIERKGLPS